MTPRRQAMLSFVMGSGRPVRILELADRFNVTQRAARYDLDAIDAWLRSKGGELLRQARRGVIVVQPPDPSEASFTPDNASYDYVCSRAERRDLIITGLLRTGPLSALQTARRLMISRNTILRDMDDVERYLQSRGVRLSRIRGRGYEITGSEHAIRSLAVDLLLRATQGYSFWGIRRKPGLCPPGTTDPLSLRTRSYVTPILKLVDARHLPSIFPAVAGVCRTCNLNTDVAAIPESQRQLFQGAPEYRAASSLAASLKNALGVSLPEDEIGYFAAQFLGRRRTAVPAGQGVAPPIEPRMEALATRFIALAESLLGAPLVQDNCPVVYPYAPTAVFIGFLFSFMGGIVSMIVQAALRWTVIVPGVIPHFFCGANAGVFANATGGRKGAMIGAFVHGVIISFLPIVLLGLLGQLGYQNTTFSDSDFLLTGIGIGYIVRLFR